MVLRVLIVEDDPNMRFILRRALEEIPEVEVVGEAVNGTEAVNLTAQLEPHAIFMDVELPEKDGIEASREILDIIPDVFLVYATGHLEYMPVAFEVYAFDYLVKPYKIDRLIATTIKIQQLVEQRENRIPRIDKAPISRGIQNKVALRIERNVSLMDTNKIIFISREKRKTIIYTDDRQTITVNESLDTLESRITNDNFMRTHRSYIINLDKVVEIQPWSRSNYLVIFGALKKAAYITEEKYKELQKKLNLN
ncbi:LytR/AlgR family response regulator transcription factor [Paradesulfitobacterium ferrireducens]|uniref:LytR/AlgR family response regulator transcription factor n=1 Tax=Paradesulfitobacterium ferrireducens TaxID=2816476 RepID=UPI001A8D312C|nr:LytTR family DNA-binding domain-containing protein [Paradesulfitobacterium ferrireducens]